MPANINEEIYRISVEGLALLRTMNATLNKINQAFERTAKASKKVSQSGFVITDVYQRLRKDGTKLTETFKSLNNKIIEQTRQYESLTKAGGTSVITQKKIDGVWQTIHRNLDRVTKKQAEYSTVTRRNTKDGGTLITTMNHLRDGTVNITRSYTGVNAQGFKFTKTTERVGGTLRRVKTDVDSTDTTLKKLTGTTNRGSQAAHNFGITWRGVVRVMAGSAVARGVGVVLRSLEESIQTATNFQRRISEVRSISLEAQQSFQAWSRSVRELSDQFGSPILDTTEGLYQAISNQIAEGADSTRFMADAQRLALIGVSSTADAVELLSGALNAYGRTVNDAKRTSDSLFRAVELGRFRVEDIANDFGRVAILGRQLGISMEELLGALATLSIQGVAPAESMTFLRNVMLGLFKPSEDMKDFLDSIGQSSGTAAVKSLGFTGVLRELGQAAERSGEPLEFLGGLFGRIRGVIGSAGLIAGFDQMLENTEKIGNAAKEADEAFKLIQESAGFQLAKEVQKTANVVLFEFAVPFLEQVNRLNNAVGGFSNVLTKLEIPIKAALGLTAFTAASKLLSVIISLRIATQAWTLALLKARAAAVLAFLGPGAIPIAAGTAAGLAVGTIINQFRRMTQDLEEIYNEDVQNYIDAQKKKISAVNAFVLEQQQITLNALQRVQQGLLDSINATEIRLNKALRETEARADIEKILFGGLAPDKRVNKIVEKIEESFKEIRNLTKLEGVSITQFSPFLQGISDLIQDLEKLDDQFDKTLRSKNRFESSFTTSSLSRAGTDGASLTISSTRKQRTETRPFDRARVSAIEASKAIRKYRQELQNTAAQILKLTEGQGEQSKVSIETGKVQVEVEREKAKAIGDVVTKLQLELKARAAIVKQFRDQAEKAQEISKEVTEGGFIDTKAQEDAINAFEQKLAELQLRVGREIIPDKDLGDLALKLKRIVDLTQDAAIKQLIQYRTSIQETTSGLINKVNQVNTSLKLEIDLQDEIREVIGFVGVLNEIDFSTFTDGQLLSSLNTLAPAWDRIGTSLQTVADRLNAAATAARNANAAAAEGSRYAGGPIRRFQTGGSVGTDSILARFDPGEFITNVRQSRRFLPQLTAINSDSARFNTGGVVNNNIGDINVTVQGGKASDVTGRQIGIAIRRELKRGTLRLS